MTSSLDVLQQSLGISNVRSIVVSEIVPVEVGFLRAIRFFGEPLVSGAPRLVLEVTLTAAERDRLEVATPVLQF
jgi:hypothetical protein